MTIGERIHLALKSAGKTQADLARHLGTNRSTVGNWVKVGKTPSAESVMPICDFLGVSPLWLLTGDENIVLSESLSSIHKELVASYDNNPGMRPAVDRLLGIGGQVGGAGKDAL